VERIDESEVNDRTGGLSCLLSRAMEPPIAPSTRTSCFVSPSRSPAEPLRLSRRDELATFTLSQLRTSAQNTYTMPPKKPKTKVKAVVKTSTRSTATAAPPTVVTNRGKEYDTAAAATRPRRATTSIASVPIKAPVKSTSQTTMRFYSRI
jgi:hypothetical protein